MTRRRFFTFRRSLTLALLATLLGSWRYYRYAVTHPAATREAHVAGLDRSVSLVLSDVPFRQALRRLAEASGADIATDEAVTLEMETSVHRVNGIFHDVPIGDAVRAILDQVESPLECRPEGRRIRVAPPQLLMRIYDLSDLISSWNAHQPPPRTTSQLLGRGGASMGPASAMSEDFSEGLQRLVEDTIRSDQWIEYGGVEGTCVTGGGYLIVVHERAVHTQIESLLSAIRAADNGAAVVDALRTVETGAPLGPQPIIDLDLPDSTLGAAIVKIADSASASVAVDWTSMNEHPPNDARNLPVRIRLRQATAWQAMRAVLDVAGSSQIMPVRVDCKGPLLAVHAAGSSREMLTRIYNVRDLIAAQVSTGIYQQDAAYGIVKMIEDMVSPDEWRNNGGPNAAMRE